MKKINLEKVLLIFIAICPVLDIASFTFRNNFNVNYSPSTFIRPLIPIIAILIIFFKNKFKLKLCIAGAIYAVYAILHLVMFNLLKTESSYGVITHEIQYLVNYTYMILNLFIYIFVFYKKDNEGLKKFALILACIYIGSIYLSVITKTYSTTYLEGIGIKGWFESGNSIGSIFTLLLFILFPMIKNKKYNKIVIPTILLIGIFLTTMLGTRTGLIGFVGVAVLYGLVELILKIKSKKKVEEHKKINIWLKIGGAIIVICIIGVVAVKGSSTLERRKFLQSISNEVIDSRTGQPSHITGDLLAVKYKIDDNEITEEYMSKPSQKALVSLYETANNMNINNSNKRAQQIIYNTYQVIYQKNIGAILFGNGFLTNIREMILEMEIPAFLYNFGIIGFVLYFIPFAGVSIYCFKRILKNIKQADAETLMLLFGSFFTFALSFFAGYTFFNSSTMMIIIVIDVLLVNKVRRCEE